MFYISRDTGQGYSWTGLYNSGNGETVLLVKNTSASLVFVVTEIDVVSDAVTRVRIHLPTTNVTVAGTEITGVNLNAGSTNAAPASGWQNETGNSIGDVITDFLIAANTPHSETFEDGLRITQNKSIGVDVATGATTLGGATIIGYFELPGT